MSNVVGKFGSEFLAINDSGGEGQIDGTEA